MLSLFIETQSHVYLITAKDVTELLDRLVSDIDPDDNLSLLQLHASNNNVFDDELETKVETFISSLKFEKENKCNL